MPHAVELIKANCLLADEEKENEIAFCRDQQIGRKTTLSGMGKVLQTRILRQSECKARSGCTTMQDVECRIAVVENQVP